MLEDSCLLRTPNLMKKWESKYIIFSYNVIAWKFWEGYISFAISAFSLSFFCQYCALEDFNITLSNSNNLLVSRMMEITNQRKPSSTKNTTRKVAAGEFVGKLKLNWTVIFVKQHQTYKKGRNFWSDWLLHYERLRRLLQENFC